MNKKIEKVNCYNHEHKESIKKQYHASFSNAVKIKKTLFVNAKRLLLRQETIFIRFQI